MTFETICRSTALVALGMAVAGPATAQQGTEDLAKAAQNPIATQGV
jgi:hypothetical protein